LARITSLKIDGVVNCLSFAVNMASFGNVNADEYASAQQSEMLCTKYIMYQKRSKFALQMDDTIDESITFFSAQNLLWHRKILLVMVYWVFWHWKYNKANTGHHTCIMIVYNYNDLDNLFWYWHRKTLIVIIWIMSIYRWIVYNSENAPENPCFFCDQCHKSLQYDQNGQKIGNFKAYKYFDQSAAAINL